MVKANIIIKVNYNIPSSVTCNRNIAVTTHINFQKFTFMHAHMILTRFFSSISHTINNTGDFPGLKLHLQIMLKA